MVKPKVFGVGFQKCGTTTLGVILGHLGYRVAGYHPFRDLALQPCRDWTEIERRALSVMQDHDAAKDTPWPLLYRQLDQAFPGAKFIHLTRDPDAWLTSALNDFDDHPNEIHRLIYGSPYPRGHEQEWLERFQQHNDDVARYFSRNPENYLHLRLEDGVTYEAICAFLNEPLVARGTPKANTRLRKKLKMAWWQIKKHF